MSNNETITTSIHRPIIFYVGLCLLLGAIAASFLLASTKLGILLATPGCGAGSGCDTVTNSSWGSVPFIGVPVSFVGLAWFTALFVGWMKFGASSKGLLWMVRLGVLGSVGFVVVMVSIDSYCQWCILTHVCNVAFWIIAEILFRRDAVRGAGGCCPIKPIFLVIAVFIGTMAILFGLKALASTKVIDIDTPVDESTLILLESRHILGSREAPIQVVMFTDYQCPDCKRIEGQLSAIMKTRNDVAVSVKHFPMNFDCNDNIGKFKLHGNACWAARAAETAAILGGEEGWQRMHKWLFSQGGSFTDQSLPPALTSLGFDPAMFIREMQGSASLELVKQDANDASELGVYFTPMVFINGVEYLWYYGGEQALANVIHTVGERVKQGGGGTVAPPKASEKLVEDWRRGKTQVLPGQEQVSWLGDGPIEIVVWSDYQTSLTVELDSEIQAIVQNDSRVRYAFRHFPIDDDCNAGISNMPTKNNGSCFLAKLVESVDVLGGNEARWSMHDWLLDRPSPINQATALITAAQLCGVDQSDVQAVMRGMEVSNRMRMDILSKNNVWRRSIPVIVVDGRFVPRWRSDEVGAGELLRTIIDVVQSELDSADGSGNGVD